MLSTVTVLLILHALVGVTLLGAITHQLVSALRRPKPARTGSFFDRYSGVNQRTFVVAVVSLYLVQIVLGALVYPAYRLNVRIPFEEMGAVSAIGLFESKEHFAGIGTGLLPFYAWLWRPENAESNGRNRIAITAILAFIVWWDFLVGHILNNLRGLA
jgi:hypothetical protein